MSLRWQASSSSVKPHNPTQSSSEIILLKPARLILLIAELDEDDRKTIGTLN